MKRIVTLSISFLFLAASTTFAQDIVYFNDVNFTVNADFTGGSVEWATGNTCDCDTAPHNFNMWNADLAFFFPLNADDEAGLSLDGGTTYAVLGPGSTIGPGNDYLASASTAASANWRQADGVNGYLGFRFVNPDTEVMNFGYARITTTGSTGHPATIVSWAYNEAGDPITIPFEPSVDGWHLLSVPGGDLTVQDLADENLVQGISDSYPGGDPNLLVTYDGPTNADYTAPGSTSDALAPGKGFFWLFYDDTDFPGTPPPEFVDFEEFFLSATFGTEQTTNVDVSFTAIPDGDPASYMVGNPFQAAFDVDGVVLSGGDGTLQTNFFSWDPGSGTYVTRVGGDYVSVWEGFWAEVDGGTTAPTFTLDVAFVDLQESSPGGSEVVSAPSLEKTEQASIEPPLSRAETGPLSAINLRLRGTLDNGEEVVDLANKLRFEEDAMVGWDRHDGSKFMPPPVVTPSYALLSLEGIHNGEAYRQSVRSLPSSLDEAVTIPVGFLATDGGSFELQALPEGSPEGWTVTLNDHETGAEVNLLNENYAFSGSAADWQNRFSVTVTPAGVVGTEDDPLDFRLSNATPNPAGASTALVLQVDDAQQVTARIFDALGRAVATVYNGMFNAGEEVRLEVDTSNLAAGTYVVRVEGETFAEARRFAVVR